MLCYVSELAFFYTGTVVGNVVLHVRVSLLLYCNSCCNMLYFKMLLVNLQAILSLEHSQTVPKPWECSWSLHLHVCLLPWKYWFSGSLAGRDTWPWALEVKGHEVVIHKCKVEIKIRTVNSKDIVDRPLGPFQPRMLSSLLDAYVRGHQ